MSNIVYYGAQDVLAEYDTYYAEGYRAWGQAYPAMAQDLRFYLGDQWTLEEAQYLREQGRHSFVINKTKKNIDWVTGYQRQNRLSSVAVPVHGGRQEVADLNTKLLLNVMTQNNGYNAISECFGAGCKTGWSLCNVYFDYNTDPINGDFVFSKDPYSGFILDPYFTKLDLSDCNWVMKRKYLSPTQAATLLPGQEEEVMQLAHDGWERDNKFTWMVFQRVPTGQRMMSYTEFFRLKYEPQRIIFNKMTKQFVDWEGDPDTYAYLDQLAQQQGHQLEILSRKKQYIEKHIILNNNYMRTEINPYGLDEYPFSLFTPIFEPESEEYTFKVQSLIRMMKDPQRELNKRRSQIIDIIEGNLNTGWIEMDGAVKNPKMLYQTGQSKRIVVNKEYTIDSIRQIQPTVVPPNFFTETEMAQNDLMDILGLNPTSFGQVESKQVSALVEMQRQAASLIGLQEVFDRLRESQKYLSRKILKMLQQWSPHKIKTITGDEVPDDFYDKNALRYDIVVQEGILTDTQRYMFFRQVMDLKQLGEPIPPGELTKLAPLQGKSEFIKDMEAYQQQQQQMAQEMQQSEMAQQQSLSQSLQAKSMADIALSKERQARAIANMGLEDERVAQAEANNKKALLDTVKAIQEMEKTDIATRKDKDARLMELLKFFQAFQSSQQVDEAIEKEENKQIATKQL